MLRRLTTRGTFIPQVDGLRFIAITFAVLIHVEQFSRSGNMFLLGWRGVQLFFVISGFILSLPFAAHYLSGGPPVHLGKYYLRRVTRLEPPYILNILFLFVILHTIRRQRVDIGI